MAPTRKPLPDLSLESIAMLKPNLVLKAMTKDGEIWLERMLGKQHWDYIDGYPYFDKETALEMTFVAKSDGLKVS